MLARLLPTLEITLYAMALATFVGVPLGVLAARRHRSMLDHLIRIASIAGLAVASFWLALMLQLVFAMDLGWLPLAGRPPATGSASGYALLAGMRYATLPAVSLALPIMATLVRFARSGMLEALNRPSLAYQRAMGVPTRVSVWRYALRHALLAVATQAGLSFGVLLAGSVVIETIFDWPGVGNYAYQSITHSDYPAIMGFVLWSGVAFVLVNCVLDLALAAIDPRERAG